MQSYKCILLDLATGVKDTHHFFIGCAAAEATCKFERTGTTASGQSTWGGCSSPFELAGCLRSSTPNEETIILMHMRPALLYSITLFIMHLHGDLGVHIWLLYTDASEISIHKILFS